MKTHKYHGHEHYSGSESEEYSKKGKRGKRGFPGAPGEPGPTGPTGPRGNEIFGEFFSDGQTALPNSDLNVVPFSKSRSLSSDLSLSNFTSPEWSGPAIKIESPGLYLLEYNLSFINNADRKRDVSVFIIENSDGSRFLEYQVQSIIGGETGPVGQPFESRLTFSGSRYLNVSKLPYYLQLGWNSYDLDGEVELDSNLPLNRVSITKLSDSTETLLIRPDLSKVKFPKSETLAKYL